MIMPLLGRCHVFCALYLYLGKRQRCVVHHFKWLLIENDITKYSIQLVIVVICFFNCLMCRDHILYRFHNYLFRILIANLDRFLHIFQILVSKFMNYPQEMEFSRGVYLNWCITPNSLFMINQMCMSSLGV